IPSMDTLPSMDALPSPSDAGEVGARPGEPQPVRRSEALARLKMRLGERLTAEGWVTYEQMEQGLEVQRRSGGFLGEILVDMGFITAAQLGRILEEIYGVPYVDLSATRIDPAIVALIPEKLAQQRRILPL